MITIEHYMDAVYTTENKDKFSSTIIADAEKVIEQYERERYIIAKQFVNAYEEKHNIC